MEKLDLRILTSVFRRVNRNTSLVQSGRSYQPLLALPVNPFGLRPRSRRGRRARPRAAAQGHIRTYRLRYMRMPTTLTLAIRLRQACLASRTYGMHVIDTGDLIWIKAHLLDARAVETYLRMIVRAQAIDQKRGCHLRRFSPTTRNMLTKFGSTWMFYVRQAGSSKIRSTVR